MFFVFVLGLLSSFHPPVLSLSPCDCAKKKELSFSIDGQKSGFFPIIFFSSLISTFYFFHIVLYREMHLFIEMLRF